MLPRICATEPFSFELEKAIGLISSFLLRVSRVCVRTIGFEIRCQTFLPVSSFLANFVGYFARGCFAGLL